jgi:hypothetical protein
MQKYTRPFLACLLVLLSGLWLSTAATVAEDPLEAGFQSPPDSAKP